MNVLHFAGSLLIIYVVSLFLILRRSFRQNQKGYVLIRSGIGGYKVSTGGMFVLPVIHKLERMDISVKRIKKTFQMLDKELNSREVEITLFVKVNSCSWEDVIIASEFFGVENGSDEDTLSEYFAPKLEDSLQRINSRYLWKEIVHRNSDLKNDMLMDLGPDLNGYIIDDLIVAPANINS